MQKENVILSATPAPFDDEQIQFLGQIQPIGFLLEVSPDWNVLRASDNLGKFLANSAKQALGLPLEKLIGRHAVHEIRGELQIIGVDGGVRRIFDVAVDLGVDDTATGLFDLSIMRSGESIVIEFEPAISEDNSVSTRVQNFLSQMRNVGNLERLADMLVSQLRSLCGYDRVMVYKFHEDQSGEVLAERRAPRMESFIGLRYPSSDIPSQARALYLRNPLRMIVDVAASNATLLPRFDSLGNMLDMSMVALRAVSPIHIQYMRNMGVNASMSISLIVGGKLWGLLSCHHHSARHMSVRMRMALEFYGQMASSIIETLIRGIEIQNRQRNRDVRTRMLLLMSVNQNGEDNMFSLLSELRSGLRATGMATYMDGRLRMDGSTLSASAVTVLINFLDTLPANEVYSTHCLAQVCPAAAADGTGVAGVLAVPISRSPRDYVLFFRDELVTEVSWAGKPEKQVSTDGLSYTPRESFAVWKGLVRGESAHWHEKEQDKGEMLRNTLVEIMLQMIDSAEKVRKQSNEQQDTLIAELNHRVRNILNLIVGLVRQCGESATSVSNFSEEVSSRVHALARAHDQLTSSGWRARSVSNMIRVEAGAYLGFKANRVIIRGSDWAIEPDAFATLALVFHEVITNAAKYGAFKDSTGHAELGIERRDTGELLLRWSEHGGDIIAVPTRRGFGSTIIERAIPHELAGKAHVEFAPSGLIATFEIPARYVAQCENPITNQSHGDELLPKTGAISFIGSDILLVEDNLLIALETESTLLEMGASSVQVVSTVAAALDVLRQFTPDYAVLDYNLGRETSVPIAERLSVMAVPFLFVTGYGDTSAIDSRFRSYPIVSKPYEAKTLIQHMQPASGMQSLI